MTTDPQLQLMGAVFKLAHAGPDAESPERKSVLWTIGVTLLADSRKTKQKLQPKPKKC
jgi:hypothetical protein